MKLTRAQQKWLHKLRTHGFVERGGWGRGQRNRPLFALVEKGLAVYGYGPEGSALKVEGFAPVGDHPVRKPISETLTSAITFLNGH